MSRKTYQLVREKILNDLRRDLIGPSNDLPDVITESPSQAYLTGILYPNEGDSTAIEDDEELNDAQAVFSSDNKEVVNEEKITLIEDNDNEKTNENKSKNFKQQSSMGIRFYLNEKTEKILLKGSFGTYLKDKKYSEEKEKEVPIWVRKIIPINETINIHKNHSVKVYKNVYLITKSKRIKGTTNYLISIFLSNKDKKEAIYQVQLEVSDPKSKRIFLCENAAREDSSKFDEFLYRNKPIFGKGYGCAVEWFDYNSTFAGVLKTEFIPTHEVASMSTELPEDSSFKSIPEDYFSIKHFAEEKDKKSVVIKLKNLADRYESWINKLPIENVEDKECANKSIQKCNEALKRIRDGIEILESNTEAFMAFKFMNEVMHTQISMKNYSKNRENTSLEKELEKENFSWRPFQLAFVLLNLKGIVNPDSEDREIVDLLWFPTGGGKTEAYLGIAAFLLGYRRITAKLESNYNKDGGVTILLRYTLRLLTTQQRDRLMRVICASEYIRAKSSVLGKSEFSIGFWVGSQVTTNKFDDLKESYYKNADQVMNEYKKQQKQVIECPCCGTKELKYEYIPSDNTKVDKLGLKIFCKNSSCYFNTSHIPVYLIDEEIYRRTPSVVISTVDKFARLPWDEKTATLFGKVNRNCEKCGFIAEGEKHAKYHQNPKYEVHDIKPFYPPELIIQDELHLITGPLGTIYGAYETAVEELCTIEMDGKKIKPKYVAATATIKNADDQVQKIFGRVQSKQFPPPGLEIEDSFFGREIDIEYNPFRLYSGVCVSGHSMKTVLLRVYAVLLQSTENLLDDPVLKGYVDPYRTLIGYFNSVRELGGTVRLLEDDIIKRIQTLQKKYNYSKQRYVNRREELTSRIPSYKIPKVLEQLNNETGEKELDVALATNMISVGMDVDRLGLMIVTGQPKQTSEYIQASSRVGRNKPGLVVTVYNPYRPRDLSHYQNFKGYHSRLYHYVEGTTATPFASRARDRALHAVAVALLRLTIPQLAKNDDARNLKDVDLSFLKILIKKRVSIVENKNSDYTMEELNQFLDEWISLSALEKELQYYYFPSSKKARINKNNRLLRRYAENIKYESSEKAKPTLDAMRQIEGTSKLFIYEEWFKNEK